MATSEPSLPTIGPPDGQNGASSAAGCGAEAPERLELLRQLALAATFDLRVHEVVRLALSLLRGRHADLRCMYCTIDAAGQFTAVQSIDPDGMPAVEGLTCDLRPASEYLAGLHALELQAVDDVLEDRRLDRIQADLAAGGTRAFLAAPLRHGPGIVGLLCADAPRVTRWSESDRRLMVELAELLAVLIQDARLKEARREEDKRLRREVDDLRRVLGALSGRVWLLDADGSARDPFEAPRGDAGGGAALLPAALRERLCAEVDAVLRTGAASLEVAVPEASPGRGPAVLRVELVALPGEDTVAAFVSDESARAAARSRLLRENAELLRANQEFERFTSASSHDLQEPLRMVSSYLQLLERRYGAGFDDQAREFLGYAVEGAKRMQALVQDLLAYARVERPGRRPRSVPFEDALDRALAALHAEIIATGAIVTRDPLPAVWGEEEQLEQLVLQLIDNALRFRRAEAPRIHVRAEARAGEWLLSVADNGQGIEAPFCERIFAPFQRLHGRAEKAGSGIGLALARRVVERHGGRIWVESVPGRGSTFYFTLPAAPPVTPATARQAST